MIRLDIPGFRRLALDHLVLDYNGTLAVDGVLIDGVAEALRDLSATLSIRVLTADTFGLAAQQLEGLPVTLDILPLENQQEAKWERLIGYGGLNCVAIGNGRNDQKMLRAAGIGIALIQREGGAAETVAAAHLVSTSILDALDLLGNPKRLIATLRS
ncbi:Soluble P-type ATPase [Verrucomicrobium sp. GAS474]|uniref:HAD family hydrolase n=1 Tax=Verrucomicrobium sp. GAS474 TaxID=1882831 RepID=UPI00087DE94E|nr:HAD hydrolase family protein [Verrucomicrobium sp. GAS474]SDT96827.1 Soluble P-type ATPase [Verrucomicrobium sp. GAS474]